MPRSQQVGSLEIAQDFAFQRREWIVQRVLWWVVVAILVAGVVGLLGTGPLSHAEAASGPLSLDYERFVRKRAPTQLDVRVAPEAAVEAEIALWLDADYLEKVDVERIMPEPVVMAAAPDRVIYRFVLADAEQPGRVTFHLQPAEPGAVDGRLGLVDGDSVTFDQFVYP